MSVLVPVYNQARYLDECLDSVAAQDYPRVELVILDDGSSDGSLEVARRWVRARSPRLASLQLRGQANRGVCATLNRLVALSQGEYLTVLAGDDFLLPGSLRRRVAVLQERPDWLAMFGDCILVDSRSRVIARSGVTQLRGPGRSPRKTALLDERLIALEVILRWSIPGPAVMAVRQAYAPGLAGPYREHLRAEDRDFHIRLVATGAFGFADVPVAAYRVHEEGLSHRPDMRSVLLESDLANLRRLRGLQRLALRVVAGRHRARDAYRAATGSARVYHRGRFLANHLVRTLIMQLQNLRIRRACGGRLLAAEGGAENLVR